ncbi:hypothetical protein C8R45DRAFT_1219701 [Mycena sanguinolenta]|nr:hypothetical protein C8R45DRAFT_1219701 [Mycena sanguinolenta]
MRKTFSHGMFLVSFHLASISVIAMSSTQSNNIGQHQQNSPRAPGWTPRVCRFCLARKLFCDGLRPRCTNCVDAKYICGDMAVPAQGSK